MGNQEHGVDEAAVVPGGASHFSQPDGEDRFQDLPKRGGICRSGDKRQSSLWGAASGSALPAEPFQCQTLNLVRRTETDPTSRNRPDAIAPCCWVYGRRKRIIRLV